MKSIENYYVSNYYIDTIPRHISNNGFYDNFLCNNIKQDRRFLSSLNLKKYIINLVNNDITCLPLCKQCIAKLPKKIREQVVYNLVVTKLKS